MLNCNDKIITVCASARSSESSFRKINAKLYLYEGSKATILLMLKHLQRKRNLPVQKPLPARTTGIQAKTWTTPPALPPSWEPHPPLSLLRSYFPFTKRTGNGAPSRLRRLAAHLGSEQWRVHPDSALPLQASLPRGQSSCFQFLHPALGPTPHPAPRAASVHPASRPHPPHSHPLQPHT